MISLSSWYICSVSSKAVLCVQDIRDNYPIELRTIAQEKLYSISNALPLRVQAKDDIDALLQQVN